MQCELAGGIMATRLDHDRLIRLTQQVWQPYYEEPLSVEDSITIFRNAGCLLDALARR